LRRAVTSRLGSGWQAVRETGQAEDSTLPAATQLQSKIGARFRRILAINLFAKAGG